VISPRRGAVARKLENRALPFAKIESALFTMQSKALGECGLGVWAFGST